MKEIEKEIDTEREIDNAHARATYGRFSNVFLSEDEINCLKSDLPNEWEYYIDRLSCYIESSGKSYQNHAATIYRWAMEDGKLTSPEEKAYASNMRFGLFIKLYPRHEHEPEARKEWDRLAPDATMAHAIMTGLWKWRETDQWTKEDGKYIPFPEEFLSSRQWENMPQT